MKKTNLLIAALALVLFVGAAVEFMTADDAEATSGKNIRVYVQTGDETPGAEYVDYCTVSETDRNKLEWKKSDIKYLVTTVESASTVKNVYERAAENLGLPIKYNDLGAIESVGGLVPDGEKIWNVHQWMPLGTPTWATVTPDPKSDAMIVTGATYCLHISGSTVIDGIPVYGKPDFRPVSDGYVFFRFLYNYDAVVGENKNLAPKDFAKRSDASVAAKIRKGAEVSVGVVLSETIEDQGADGTGVWYYFTDGKDPDFNGARIIGEKKTCGTAGSKEFEINVDTSEYPGAKYLVISALGKYVKDGGTGRHYAMLELSEGLVEDTFTREIRKNGFWMEGRGSNMGEVMLDIMDANGLEFEYFSGDSGGNDLQFWIDSMFGIRGDESVGTDAWTYWSQYTYVNDKWGYNDYTLGHYDPGVYGHAACVYIVSVNPDFNVAGDLPRISDFDPAADVMEIYKKVKFMDGETLLGEQTVRFGNTVDFGKIPAVAPPAGKIFTGWGDIGTIITRDTVFDAGFTEPVPGRHLARFFADGEKFGLMHSEYVSEGNAPSYIGTVDRKSTVSTDYSFSGWTPSLSGISADTDFTPAFAANKRIYDVSFLDYDGHEIAVRGVGYGDVFVDFPSNPSRQSTVERTYDFIGWSSNLSEYREADLSCVKSGMLVYAYYQSNLRLYTVTVMCSGETKELQVRYGNGVGDEAVAGLFPGYLAKLYRDSVLSDSFSTYDPVRGDTALYAVKIPGNYTIGYGADANTVTVTHDTSTAAELTASSGKITVADASQMRSGKTVKIDNASLVLIAGKFGRNAMLTIAVPEGEITLSAGFLTDLGGDVTYGVSNTQKTSSIIGALRVVNYYGAYTPSLKSGGSSVRDAEAEITLPLRMAPGAEPSSARVWSLTNAGVLGSVECEYLGEKVAFRTNRILNFVTGYDASSAPPPNPSRAVPYGDAVYSTYGSTPETYESTLLSMSLASEDGTVYLPSAFEGYPLKRISKDAFLNLSGATALVIPPTVKDMDVSSLDGAGITDVYFLGDKPEISGTTAAVFHRASGTAGWESSVDVLEIRIYNGDSFRFSYFAVDGEITLHRYLEGKNAAVPSEISVDGRGCPLTRIGDSAFASAETDSVIIPKSVRTVSTRAFYKSSVMEVSFEKGSVAKTICDEAFRECRQLRSVGIPEGVTYIGFEAFRMCDTFKAVAIPDSCLVLGTGAFYACGNLAEISVGGGISEIPDRCFAYCVLLNNVRLPENVTAVGKEAFMKCYELTGMDTASVGKLEDRAFYLCRSLESVTLGEGLRSLGKNVFFGCPMLKTVEAYCDMPQGILDAFENSETVNFRVSSDAEGWTIKHEIIGDGGEEAESNSSLVYALAGMVALFAVAGTATVIVKRRR